MTTGFRHPSGAMWEVTSSPTEIYIEACGYFSLRHAEELAEELLKTVKSCRDREKDT